MRIAVLLAAFLLTAPLAQAQEPGLTPAPGIELTPMAGYRSGGGFEDAVTGDSLDLDEGESFGLILNIDHDADTQWEFMASHQRTELRPGPSTTPGASFDLDVTHVSGGGLYVWRGERVEPYIGAGLGLTHLSPRDSGYDSETRVLFQLVGGYKFWLAKQFALRLDLRGYATLMDTDAQVFCGNGACVAKVDSRGFGQLELNAGLTFRF